MDLYAVFGNPVKHSRSPEIHQAFAAQRDEQIDYQKIQVAENDFADVMKHFFGAGGKGANVTLPFKQEAFDLCNHKTERAEQAGAVNTLWQQDDRLHGDNTDGIGLVTDIRHNLGWQLNGNRILILGAGGAVRGILGPLLAEQPKEVTIANRTVEKAEQLAEIFSGHGIPVFASPLDNIRGQYDIIINGVSSGLSGEMPDIANDILAADCACYDMVYGTGPTPFMRWGQQHGAVATADGLGMLVEQAAESFSRWHGWRPDTTAVITDLRKAL